MMKIGEFSKLSMLTIKALRFYEKEGLLVPKEVDEWTGYRYYETNQLETAATIKALRQLDFSVDEVKAYLDGQQIKEILMAKEAELKQRQFDISHQLSIIKFLSEEKEMKYQAVIKEIPECVVYSEERILKDYSEVSMLVLGSATECRRLNPNIECTKPDYGFCEYLDGEYKESNILTRYSQAVTEAGEESERIKFRTLPAIKAICIYHKGTYDLLGEAYAYIMKYANENGYKVSGLARECYIDGIWNKDNTNEWLTEIQLPIE
ncbi:MerR family transcriptional regulator [Tissierella sp. Yu-01]|uniref:MerR family transcriptional regulator n=1 Tax=Tissierella sp. Yu-01 TaxID=3035694 RepID=UPI00240E6A34|nr:MerR family transcriptional regulator [Tissierella sp. Yu-01]WFA09225.1 MerR family transcriptional regulator [Tissierella sp. Yu-01]